VTHTRRFLGAALALLIVTGCSSRTSSPVATTTVDLPASYKFVPADITIAAGATVTWTNHDNFTHSVQFLDGDLSRDPAMLPQGATTSVTFPAAGLYHYQCSLPPQNMKGTVPVTS